MGALGFPTDAGTDFPRVSLPRLPAETLKPPGSGASAASALADGEKAQPMESINGMLY